MEYWGRSQDCRFLFCKLQSLKNSQKEPDLFLDHIVNLYEWLTVRSEQQIFDWDSYQELYQWMESHGEGGDGARSPPGSALGDEQILELISRLKALLHDLLSGVPMEVFLSAKVNTKEFDQIKKTEQYFSYENTEASGDPSVLRLLVTAEKEKEKFRRKHPECEVFSVEEIHKYVSQFYQLDDLTYTKLYIDSRYQMLRDRTNIDTLIVGASAARSDFLESAMASPSVCLGITGLDMYYTWKSVEKALECNPNIKTVVFPMCYYTLFLSFLNHPNPVQRSVMEKVVKPIFESSGPYSFTCSWEKQKEKREPMLDVIVSAQKFCEQYDARVIQQLTRLPYYNQQFYQRPPNGQNTYCFRDKSALQNNRAVEVLIQMQERLFQKSNATENVAYLEEMMKLLQRKKISLLVVIPPVTDYYQKASNPKYYDFFYQTLAPMIEQYGFSVLDYYQSDLFFYEDYVDYDHLNEKGARKLSKLVSDHCG